MPSFGSTEDAAKSEIFKFMLVGESGSGKTGSLISLVEAGYHLRIVDLDDGLPILRNLISEQCPERASQVSYMSFRDMPKIQGDQARPSSAKAMVGAMRALDRWEDDTVPAEWGPKHVLVVDSLTMLGRAAYWWAQGMSPGTKDRRQWYGTGQEALSALVMKLTSPDFNANVIIITHVGYDTTEEGAITKAYPTSLGQALRDRIPACFNTVLLADKTGTGKNLKRIIRTVPTNLLQLKTPVPMRAEDQYPLETGLASIVKELIK